ELRPRGILGAGRQDGMDAAIRQALNRAEELAEETLADQITVISHHEWELPPRAEQAHDHRRVGYMEMQKVGLDARELAAQVGTNTELGDRTHASQTHDLDSAVALDGGRPAPVIDAGHRHAEPQCGLRPRQRADERLDASHGGRIVLAEVADTN